MGRLYAVPQQLKSAWVIPGLVALVLLPLLAPPLQSQDSASLYGTVRDAQGKPLAGATIRLQVKDTLQVQTAHTDSQGNYRFVALHGGVYILRASMVAYSDAEIPSLFLGPNEAKNVDLTLLPSKASSPAPAPEFFDQPQFTVAGVTDTTNLGGHGSDTMVRARESLAKEAVSLGKSRAGVDATAVSTQKSLREAVEHDPSSLTANHRLGRVLIEDGKAREAIPYLERAAELKPGDSEIACDLALANARAGNYERARDIAQALLAQSNKAELHHLLGEVQEKLGNSLEAVREYQRAAELDPSEAYLFDWGSELLLHHAPEPALEVFTKGNHLFPQSLRMLIGLGAAWFAQGSYERAAQRICEASDLDPDNSIPYVFLGKMLNAEPTPSQDVVEKLHRFVAHRPEDAAANYYYAVALWKLRKGSQDMTAAAQVEALLKNAVQFDPKFGAAYLELGILHFEQKDNPSAIADYQHAIEADPQMEEAHYRLAQAYRQHGDTAKAAAELKVYDQIAKESARQAERERHEVRQFVYTLRDQPPAPNP